MIYDNTYLMHYGVKGQQWGVRRFQNEDGTLTEEGKARYLKTLDKHRQDIYNNMSKEGRALVDRQLASGKDFDDAVRSAMIDHNKTVNRNIQMKSAKVFIKGLGLVLLGKAASKRGHAFIGAAMQGYGTGSIGAAGIASTISTLATAGSNKQLKNMKMEDIEVLKKDDERKKIKQIIRE